MDAIIDRVMFTYDLLANRTAAASDEARAKLLRRPFHDRVPSLRLPLGELFRTVGAIE